MHCGDQKRQDRAQNIYWPVLSVMLGFEVLVNFGDKGITKVWNSVWSRLLQVSMRVSNSISCLLSRNIWFAEVKQEDYREKVARIPKIRRKRVYFHDKKSQIHFLKGQKWPKTEKNWNKKVIHSIRYPKNFGKTAKN